MSAKSSKSEIPILEDSWSKVDTILELRDPNRYRVCRNGSLRSLDGFGWFLVHFQAPFSYFHILIILGTNLTWILMKYDVDLWLVTYYHRIEIDGSQCILNGFWWFLVHFQALFSYFLILVILGTNLMLVLMKNLMWIFEYQHLSYCDIRDITVTVMLFSTYDIVIIRLLVICSQTTKPLKRKVICPLPKWIRWYRALQLLPSSDFKILKLYRFDWMIRFLTEHEDRELDGMN